MKQWLAADGRELVNAIFTCCLVIAVPAAQSGPEITEGSDYRIVKVKSPVNGEPVYFIRCNDGSMQCSYKWDTLCGKGKALNADPLKGVGQDKPVYIRDRDGTPMRVFICADPR